MQFYNMDGMGDMDIIIPKESEKYKKITKK